MKNTVNKFFAFDEWLGAEPVGSGNINDTYRARFLQDGQPQVCLLQRLNHHVFRQPQNVAANIRLIADYLQNQTEYPFALALPIAGLDGNDLQTDADGNVWRMFTYLENCYSPENAPDPAAAYEAARAYGLFLRALRYFPSQKLSETIPGFHDSDRRWVLFEQTIGADPAGRVAAAQPEIGQIQAALPVFQHISRLKHSGALPLRVTHNDTKAGNILLDIPSGAVKAVIDWDTIMPGTVLSDFGDMVRTFAPDAYEDAPAELLGLRREVLGALHRGFEDATGDFLTVVERENLPLGARWIIAEQALRFLTDHLAGDVYYKIRHPEHNLIRARNQLALLQLVDAYYGSGS
ncbi:MAG TPA: aminoglycoside phosphotransferase family protein [Saprospiraceae bacterium]|nr:aminoglycoside phosphotransferase family protein [Saprospiraceae bacterium]